MIEQITALYDKNLSCPHCQAAFSSKRVRSGSLSMLKRDSDFCTYFKEQALNPILYTVNVCPSCGFAFTDLFDERLAPGQKKLVSELISAKWTPKELGGIRSLPAAVAAYKLAIYAAELTDQVHSVKAGLYLRLAWLYRFTANAAEERRFLQIAVHEYEQSYIHSDYTRGEKEMSEVRILYLIGDLMRRIEQYDKAIQYFSHALEFRNRTIETGILQMAQDQWAQAREEYKEKKKQPQVAMIS
ncbi:DUF2225 domain-containing protein [Brevibacillus ruminantium]|uniref:DUF2225 domain-containing protein n=1 Tax=Brevibacillus ruminantium TaxID=2950604 RepID=A0ABY4WEA6_9BACL|nr:DUF2225 domain-containing protein [Brevibacillus ruminantium]USG64277.1 DUF2225 domain-containing protein [Brevibacillus ruminantium]